MGVGGLMAFHADEPVMGAGFAAPVIAGVVSVWSCALTGRIFGRRWRDQRHNRANSGGSGRSFRRHPVRRSGVSGHPEPMPLSLGS